MDILLLTALFVIKHFICDYVLQSESMVQEKGQYGSLGGLSHALTHFLGTFIVLSIAFVFDSDYVDTALKLSLLDGVVHYHIDWVKQKLSSRYTVQDQGFWILLGADQMLHYLTYLFIIGLLIV